MFNRDEIIKALECCSYLDRPICAECPEDGPGFGFACRDDLMKQACFMLKMLDVTPEELKRLKLCRHECKVDCLLESFNRVVEERDALRKAQEPRIIRGNDLIWDDRRTVWLETRHDGKIEPVKCHGMRGKLWFFSAYTGGKCFAAIGADYRKTWRCWDKEPTKERQGAEAWE